MVTFTRYTLGILLLFTLSVLNAQSKNTEQVLDIEAQRFAAMMRADTLALRSMLADDLMYLHSNALKETKAEHLAAIASKKLVYEKMDREEASVRFYGKTALVNGTVKVQGKLKDNAFEVRLLYTAIYRKKKCNWLLINWQSTSKV